MPTSQSTGFSHFQAWALRGSLDEETTDWRAVCRKPPVRFGGRGGESHPDPYPMQWTGRSAQYGYAYCALRYLGSIHEILRRLALFVGGGFGEVVLGGADAGDALRLPSGPRRIRPP